MTEEDATEVTFEELCAELNRARMDLWGTRRDLRRAKKQLAQVADLIEAADVEQAKRFASGFEQASVVLTRDLRAVLQPTEADQ